MSVYRLPRHGSLAQVALRGLHSIGGSATLATWHRAAAAELSASEFANRVLSPLSRHALISVEGNCVITPAGRAMLGEQVTADVDAEPAQLAQPRSVPPFRPLQRSSKSAIVYREGAFDYRDSPSLIGGQRVPYRTPT